jgi:hypothetical protein
VLQVEELAPLVASRLRESEFMQQRSSVGSVPSSKEMAKVAAAPGARDLDPANAEAEILVGPIS